MTKLLDPTKTWADNCCHICGNPILILKEVEVPTQTVTKGTIKTKQKVSYCNQCNISTLGVEPGIYNIAKFMTKNEKMLQPFDSNKSYKENLVNMEHNVTTMLIAFSMLGLTVKKENQWNLNYII